MLLRAGKVDNNASVISQMGKIKLINVLELNNVGSVNLQDPEHEINQLKYPAPEPKENEKEVNLPHVIFGELGT